MRGHRRWSSEAARWDNDGRPTGLLLSGRRLAIAEAWRAGEGTRRQPRVAETLAGFLAASRVQENRRHRRQRAIVSSTAAALGALGIAATIFAFVARDRAAVARSRERAALADAALARDPARSLALAEEAVAVRATRQAVAARDVARRRARLLRIIQATADRRPVNAVGYVLGGRLIASGGDDGHLRLWDPTTGEPRGSASTGQEVRNLIPLAGGSRILVATTTGLQIWNLACLARAESRCMTARHDQAHDGREILAVAASHNGRTIVTAGVDDPRARVWNDRLRSLGVVSERTPVSAVAVSIDGSLVAAGTQSGAVTIRRRDGTPMIRDTGHTLRVRAMSFGPRNLLATGSDDGTVRLVDPPGRTRRLLGRVPGHAQQIAFSPLGVVAAGGENGTVVEWDARGGSARTLVGHTGIISSLTFDRSGRRLLSASDEGAIRMWEARSGGLRAFMSGHSGLIRDVAASPGATTIVSAGVEGEIRIWDTGSGTSRVELVGHTGAVPSVVFDQSGDRVLSASLDGTARVWDAATGRIQRRIRAGAPLQAAAFGPNGSIITAGWDGTVARWGRGQKPIWRAAACGSPPCGTAYVLAVSPDRQLVASGSEQGGALIDAQTGQAIRSLHDAAFVLSAQFSHDGQRVLTAGDDGRALVTPVQSGPPPLELRHSDKSPVYEARLSPDGREALTVGGDGRALLWDIAAQTATELRLPDDAGGLYSGDLSSRQLRVVVAGASGTVWVFDDPTRRGRLLAGQTGTIERVRITKDARRVVTIGQDAVARAWDPATGKRTDRLTGATAGLLDLAESPRGDAIAVSANDATARIYTLR